MKKIFWFLLIFSLFIGIKNVEAVGNGYEPTSPILRDVATGSVANSSTPKTNPNGYVSTSTTLRDVATGSTTSSSSSAMSGNSNTNTSPSVAATGGISGGFGGGLVDQEDAPKDYESTGDNDKNFMKNDQVEYISCGDLTKLPKPIPKLTSFAYNALKVLTPIVLIVIGTFNLLKSIMAGKEDEIKKAQASLVKKLLIGGLVFLVALIVQYVVKVTAKTEDSNGVISCMSCFLNDEC